MNAFSITVLLGIVTIAIEAGPVNKVGFKTEDLVSVLLFLF